jgi:hypothetical protein
VNKKATHARKYWLCDQEMKRLPTDSQSEVVKFKITSFQNNTEERFIVVSVMVLFLDLGFEEIR